MRLGFIYPSVAGLVKCLWYLNSAEHVKSLTAWLWSLGLRRSLDVEEIKVAKSVGIDIHHVLKWVIIASLFLLGISEKWALYLVVYLIAGNLFTYFYYHTWGSGFSRTVGIEAQRRRFVAFVFSIAFYLVGYAYLYQFHFVGDFRWPGEMATAGNAIYGSVTTAFTLTHGDFTPLTAAARTLVMTELLNTFLFFTLIIANAIPKLDD